MNQIFVIEYNSRYSSSAILSCDNKPLTFTGIDDLATAMHILKCAGLDPRAKLYDGGDE